MPALRWLVSAMSTAISQTSIPERLPRLQRVLNPLLRLLLTAQRLEPLALQVEDVLLDHRRSRSDVAAAQDFSDFCPQLHFIVGDVVALAPQVDAHLESGQKALAGRGDV